MGLQVIEVNLTSEAPQEIAAGKTYRFSYSVEWTQTDKQYEDRFSRYLDYSYVASPPPAPSCRLQLCCAVQASNEVRPGLFASVTMQVLRASDSLVLHLQLLHDGHLPVWPGRTHSHAHPAPRLRQGTGGAVTLSPPPLFPFVWF